jgi:crotonobetainyl-CoA:carnitine CoA-transferase CaiB-like acyl-CoA transferase
MGPLAGVRVVELSHERVAWAGKLMGDLGADVVVVEPPGGSPQRSYGPFAGDEPGPENSLWWWHYNTSKQGVVLDLATDDGRAGLDRLLAGADVLLEAEVPGTLDRTAIADSHPRLIHCSVTPFGSDDPRSEEPSTDLTILAAGPIWMCGYDDHQVPPVRGGGNQGLHTASHFAVMGVLTALLAREVSGLGQHVDVSAFAAANVTTEVGTYGWLIGGMEVQRQTGRHAAATLSMPTQLRCADGRYVNSGLIPRSGKEFTLMLQWLDSTGFGEEFPLRFLMELGTEKGIIRGADFLEDPMLQEIVASARELQMFLAQRLSAYEFFRTAQEHGVTAGVIYSPEEILEDPHFVAREWPVSVEHPDRGETYTYPGHPARFTATPWAIASRAPRLGEHQHRLQTS